MPEHELPPMDPRLKEALTRAARGDRRGPAQPVPMGIRYRTPAAPARPAPVDRRPLWMTLASATELEELAEVPARGAEPRRLPRATRPAPAAARPASAPPAAPAAQTNVAGAADSIPQARVLRRFDAFACLACGNRYRNPDDEHGCGQLTPVTVTVTAGPATPASAAVLGSYAAFACETCGTRWSREAPDHGCGPLTPVTVTITVRAAGEQA